MDVVSLCALRASGFEWQPRAGAYALTVICKATFELRPNECALSLEQEDPSDADTYWNDDPNRSVVAPSDRVPYKPRADIVLVGHAYAPKQQPARSIMTRLLVGAVDKSIEVWCDRGVQPHAGQLLEGPRQAKMLLTWERAAGGPNTNNPIGMRFDAAPDPYGRIAIPNLQPPGVHYGKWGDTFAPLGYGPIAPHWPSRMQKLYKHAAGFSLQGWEGRPMPDPFDYRYFNVAPRDQQIDEVRANERIVLENLHPAYERLVTNLPGIRPRAVVDRPTGPREEIELMADTLWIDADRGICTVVWRGRIALRAPREAGRVAFWVDELPTTLEVSSATTREGAIAPALEDDEDEPGSTTVPLAQDRYPSAQPPPLPFVKAPPAPPRPVGISPAAPPPWLGPLASLPVSEAMTFVSESLEPAKDPLPFARGVEAPVGPPSESFNPPFAAQLKDDDDRFPTITLNGEQELRDAGLAATPFRPHAAPASPPQVFTPAAVSTAFYIHKEPEAKGAEAPRAQEPPPEARPQEVAPPPRIGPLAVMATTAEAEAAPEGASAADIKQATPAPEEPAAPVAASPKPDEFPLERCAAITARIAHRKPDKARILEEEELSAGQWTAIEKRWTDAIRDETKRGKKTLLDRFDAAYVAELEKERGAIEARDYAKLKVAAERGTVNEVLSELRLPRGAVMRIERVWMLRLAESPGLGGKVEEAIEVERRG